MLSEEFKDGRRCGHLGYQNGTILAILNLCVTLMLPIKFWLNLTYSLGGVVVWRISKWLPWQPSWILKRTNFSISEFLCHSDASHQVSAQNYGLGGDVIWIISSWPPWRPPWIAELKDFSSSESLCHCNASHQVSAQSVLQFGRCCLKNFKMAAILDIRMEQF